MSEEKKKRLKEYQKNYREAKKSKLIINEIVFFIVNLVAVLIAF